MTSDRRLAAIFFADIAGYTAMMQQDEAKAIRILNRYSETLNKHASQYYGEIVKQYGDGSLVLFSSAINAVNCSIEMQRIFRQDPVVPLRIGLHVGEVYHRENDYFGNDINVASRVESMGVPGSILITKELKDKLKNQANVSYTSLGKYLFKNIQDPLEVLAISNEGLVIPDRKKVKGKFEKRSFWTKYKYIVAGLIAIVGIGVALYLSYFIDHRTEADANPVLNKRVAILPLINESNDASVDVLGKMASDWITQVLLTNKAAKVVNVSKNVMNDIENSLAAFVEESDVDILIDGRYYTINDQVTLNTNINTTSPSEILNSVVAEGEKADPITILNDLQDKLMGYWFLGGENWIGTNPPKFSAYKKFLELDEVWISEPEKSEKILNEVLTLDSTFYRAYMSLAVMYSNLENYAAADSMIRFINEKNFDLSEFEQLRLEAVTANIDGDLPKIARLYDEIFTKFGQQELDVLSYNLRVNNPERVIEIYNSYPELGVLGDSYSAQISFSVIAESYFRLKDYSLAVDYIEAHKEDIVNPDIIITHLRSLVHQNDKVALDRAYEFYQSKDVVWIYPNNENFFNWAICQEAYLLDNDVILSDYAQKLNAFSHSHTEEVTYEQDMYTSYIYLNRLDSAVHYAEIWGQKFGSWFMPDYFAVSAMNGQLEGAAQYLKTFEPSTYKYDFGKSAYDRAKVLTALGQYDDAVASLRLAFRQGMPFLWYTFQNDIFFKALSSHDGFIELTGI